MMRFVHIPKNAGTSIQNMLGPTSLGHRRVHELKGSPFFACVRNPYDRAVSAYWFIRQTQARVATNKLIKSEDP